MKHIIFSYFVKVIRKIIYIWLLNKVNFKNMFEKLKIEKIAECFTAENSKTVIFCNWDEALKIQLELKNSSAESFTFDEDFTDKKDGINALTVYHAGREFIFIDERDAIKAMKVILESK